MQLNLCSKFTVCLAKCKLNLLLNVNTISYGVVGNVVVLCRSTEEVFALFVSVAFVVDAGKGIYKGKQTIDDVTKITSIRTVRLTATNL